jgi:hypothetical protein
MLHAKRESGNVLEESDEEIHEKSSEWPSQEVRDEVASACRGAAVTLIPLIIQLGKLPAKATA